MGRVIDALDAANRALFGLVAWLTLAMALLGGLIVLLRYGFAFGSIAMQEAMVYLHALVLLGAAAHTLGRDGHVRVDIFYSRWAPRRQALVNLLGTVLFLWPFGIFLIAACFGYVADSWRRLEVSAEADGLPAIFLLKSLILVFAVQLLAQGVVQLRAAWRGAQLR